MERRITAEDLGRFTAELRRYKAGRLRTENRLRSAENWWRLRNRTEEEKEGAAPRAGFRSSSGWLHNVICNKHADAMDAIPAPVILPREESDRGEAELLTAVIPCVLEQNRFESVYSEAMWQKLKFGTCCYRVVWDSTRLGGLGDIAITRCSLMNLYWEPGISELEQSKYLFDVEAVDRERFLELYPEAEGESGSFTPAEFSREEQPNSEDKVTVVNVYYRRGGVLHYLKYCGERILECTENDPELAERGIYDHGRYPYVTDALFPIEGSPCGYGYVDLCRNPQTEMDLLRTAIVQNAMAGATPRQFVRSDGSINEEEYLDLTRPLVHVTGNLGEDSIRTIPHAPLDNVYITLLQETINELRETSANTETATGSVSGSVTAASAITALQEASGKTGRDASRGSYRAFCRVVELCIELIRQFYGIPRQFRIAGPMGEARFVSYSNRGIAPCHQGNDFGLDMGYRVPAFDVRIEAVKKDAYSASVQNGLALQLYSLGFFSPEHREEALKALELMEFEGREKLLSALSRRSLTPPTM